MPSAIADLCIGIMDRPRGRPPRHLIEGANDQGDRLVINPDEGIDYAAWRRPAR